MEIFRTLGALAEPPRAAHRVAAEVLGLGPVPDPAVHTDLFTFQLYPYASVYLGSEGMLGGEARDRVAGFWRALGEAPPNEPDHLALLLAGYAELCERHGDAWKRARRAFLWEHLVSWLSIYLPKVASTAGAGSHGPDSYYPRWAELLSEALAEETASVGTLDRPPAALQDPSGLADPRTEGADAFLGSVLAPARSGMILTRDDLRRLGSTLGLAVRAGERRFVLRELLAQDPPSVLQALADLARNTPPVAECWGDVATAWQSRRSTAADRLKELARDA